MVGFTMRGIILSRLALVFVVVIIFPKGVHSQWAELYEDFRTCKGRPTGMDEYVKDAIPRVVTCLTRTGKWCKATCALQRLGFMNETGYFASEEGKKEYVRTTKITNPTRDQLFNDLETCVGKESYDPRGKCMLLRKAYYCFYNRYIQRCKIPKPKKDLAVASEENGLLNDAVDGIGILGSKKRPNPTPLKPIRPNPYKPI